MLFEQSALHFRLQKEFLDSLQKEWMSMSDHQKQIYKDKSEESRKQYLKDLEEWNESLNQESNDERKKLVDKLRALEAHTVILPFEIPFVSIFDRM